jgi:NADPH-dependent glutamate synthase beta subunit-like oxidoreductase/2,4-dienoyl-CoA reductase-like NADH-dependent reductase (Old Yellow Enzyme family)
MGLDGYEPFYLHSPAELRDEISRLGLDLPVADDDRILETPLAVGGCGLDNRFCALPVAGLDANPEGTPGPLTLRRYTRLAAGGYGLLWLEGADIGEPTPGRLELNERTFDAFRDLVATLRAEAHRHDGHPRLILQLRAAPGVGTETLTAAARLAHRAGFDGVDLPVFTRAHAALMPSVAAALRAATPDMLLASSLMCYDARRAPDGFGVDDRDVRRMDLTEPLAAAHALVAAGVTLLCVRANSPNVLDPPAERGLRPRTESQAPHEHPLTVLARKVAAARALRAALPGVRIAGSGFAWLRGFAPRVAAALIHEGTLDVFGLARAALAEPDAPTTWRRTGSFNPARTCMVCYACSRLLPGGGPVGCVIRDDETYGPVYRQRFPTDPATTPRCHGCEAAPCIAAAPTLADIPGFVRAFESGDVRRAFDILRRDDLLPGMGAQLAWRDYPPEAACVEKILTGKPVPIRAIQREIQRVAQEQSWTGVRVPERESGRSVCIVGGGPAGIAAAARLIELGHRVEIIERSDRLGGVPGRLLRRPNFSGGAEEVDALLRPALTSGRLTVRFGSTPGVDATLPRLRSSADAVLITAGLWGERTLGRIPGVIGGLDFLDSVARGEAPPISDAAVLLIGGDSAMDAARALQGLGADPLHLVFAGPRSALHWHMDEAWFASPGVHLHLETRPLGFFRAPEGSVLGVRVARSPEDEETLLPAGIVVEAMGLEIDDATRAALAGLPFQENGLVAVAPGTFRIAPGLYAAGACVNGGASVAGCVSEGMRAADEIHAELSRS